MTIEECVTFEQLGLSASILDALKKKGFEKPSPIQAQVIPILLAGEKDVLGQAQTGTGKTAAFGLPLIERLKENCPHVQALVLTPTRELAVQVANEIASFCGTKRLETVPVYGGQSITDQLRRLRKGVDIVVGTPGRIIDHIRRGSLKLGQVEYLVLDEADEMLNMGFLEDVEQIINATNKDRSTLLFSATMPPELARIANRYMRDTIRVSVKKEQLTTSLTEQIYYELLQKDRFEALCRIIDIDPAFYGMVFCKTKLDVDAVVSRLLEKNYSAEGLHGDISQANREKILMRFKRKRVKILVATDVAARGIDVNDLTHVLNYSLPQSPESYVHRIGRTGRAGKKGTAITFVLPSESYKVTQLQRVTKTKIQKSVLPNVAELIKVKTARLHTDLMAIVESEQKKGFLETAKGLLENNDPEKLVASLLEYSFKDHLDPSAYREIQEIRSNRRSNERSNDRSSDRRSGDRRPRRDGQEGRPRRSRNASGGSASNAGNGGNGRLFVARGKQDEITPGKLIAMIKKKARIDESKIGGIEIYDKFSFVNVPREMAESIITAFRPHGRGRRSIIELAK
ncbi:MAG: RNA helicase [SAR324 cluster bacterium]|uniref:RNA helicase n=1 Tax=SAR324 cluster bacterium TaxID=2024889 RepID=A0A2A4ST00_9DELT|nr:MAG: RNA helicase [SAR324 cluster bacterium]